MDLLLFALYIYVPQFIKKRKLATLFEATSDAFQVAAPSLKGFSFDDSLKLYAQFTREQADNSICQGNGPEVQSRLFQNAYQIGRQFRTDFRTADSEVMQTGKLIYKLLKIDFQGEPGGHIVINRCFFSAYYSGSICRLISSLDEGLLVGLAGGGRLSFSQRITEGNKCCRAFLEAGRKLK